MKKERITRVTAVVTLLDLGKQWGTPGCVLTGFRLSGR